MLQNNSEILVLQLFIPSIVLRSGYNNFDNFKNKWTSKHKSTKINEEGKIGKLYFCTIIQLNENWKIFKIKYKAYEEINLLKHLFRKSVSRCHTHLSQQLLNWLDEIVKYNIMNWDATRGHAIPILIFCRNMWNKNMQAAS